MGITFRQYSEAIKDTLAKYVIEQGQDGRFTELILGLYEEGAEVTSPIRRSIRGNYHEQKIDFEHLSEEVGDVFWYISQITDQLPNSDLEQVAKRNLEKTHTIYQKKYNEDMQLDINNYVKLVTSTYRDDLPSTEEERARFFCMGLIKEIGKLAELFGEHRIDGTRLDIYQVQEKLGDGLWYLAALCQNYGLDLEMIVKNNIAKTHSRYNADGLVKGRE